MMRRTGRDVLIKILHTADVHLDSPLKSLALRDPDLRAQVQAATRAAFTRIVDLCLAEEVAALLIAGDLFDGAERSARTAAFLTAAFDRLNDAGVAVFYIKGNHDAENPLTGALSLPENVHVFGARGGKVQLREDIWVHGVSFAARQAPDSLLPKFAAPVPGAVNIALLHSSLAGAAGHDVYAPCSVADLAAMGFDYWALGHVHRRQVHDDAPWIVMPGIPQGRDIGEAGAKSASLLTISAGQITLEDVPTSVVEFTTWEVNAAGAETDEALRALLRQALRDLAAGMQSDSAVVRVILQGQTPRHWQVLRDRDVWTRTAQDMARETGRLWLDKLVIDLSAPAHAAPTPTDELAKMMQALRTEEGFDAALGTELDEVLAELPPQQRAALVPDEAAAAALRQRLARAGATRVVALMKGATD